MADISSATIMRRDTADAKNQVSSFGRWYTDCIDAINTAKSNGDYTASCRDLSTAQQEHLKDLGYRVKYTRPTCYEEKDMFRVVISWDIKPRNILQTIYFNIWG